MTVEQRGMMMADWRVQKTVDQKASCWVEDRALKAQKMSYQIESTAAGKMTEVLGKQ